MIDPFVRKLAKMIVADNSELANDLYFALDEEFVKKPDKNQDSYQELTKIIHNWVNPKTIYHGTCIIEDAPDGSGDGLLTFPEGVIESFGWKEGDKINVELSEDNNCLILTKIT